MKLCEKCRKNKAVCIAPRKITWTAREEPADKIGRIALRRSCFYDFLKEGTFV